MQEPISKTTVGAKTIEVLKTRTQTTDHAYAFVSPISVKFDAVVVDACDACIEETASALHIEEVEAFYKRYDEEKIKALTSTSSLFVEVCSTLFANVRVVSVEACGKEVGIKAYKFIATGSSITFDVVGAAMDYVLMTLQPSNCNSLCVCRTDWTEDSSWMEKHIDGYPFQSKSFFKSPVKHTKPLWISSELEKAIQGVGEKTFSYNSVKLLGGPKITVAESNDMDSAISQWRSVRTVPTYITAGLFSRTAPWLTLEANICVSIESPLQKKPKFAQVLGSGFGAPLGLCLWSNYQDFVDLAITQNPSAMMKNYSWMDFSPDVMPQYTATLKKLNKSCDYGVVCENHPNFFDAKVEKEDEVNVWYQIIFQVIPSLVKNLTRKGLFEFHEVKKTFFLSTILGEMKCAVKFPAENFDLGCLKLHDVPGNPMVYKMEADQVLSNPRVLEDIPDEALRKAQLIVYKGFSAIGDSKKQFQCAKQALELSDKCGDAYILQVAAEGPSMQVKKAHDLFLKAFEACKRAVGDRIESYVGTAFDYLEMRPYFRALVGLIDTYWKYKQTYQAVAYCKELLRLDPRDPANQRTIMLDLLMEVRQDKEAVKLMKMFPNEHYTLHWYWTSVLIQFREGKISEAIASLTEARKRNAYVIPLLLKEDDTTQTTGSYSVTITEHGLTGNREEAVYYVKNFHNHWRRTKGAIKFLQAHRTDPLPSRPNYIPEVKLPTKPKYNICGYCGKESNERLKVCSKCQSIYYCGVNCQRSHWSSHKKECKEVAQTSATAPPQPKKTYTDEDISKMSVKQLKQLMNELSIDTTGCVEKEDLVKALKAARK